MHGLAEFDAIIDIWINRLKAGMERKHSGK